MIVKALILQFIGISERNFLIVVEAKRCGGESDGTKLKRISPPNSDLLEQWITKTTHHGDEWFRDLFSLDFALSEFLRGPDDEDTTEWDPSQEQHSYYRINPSENISYRYSYDTGEKKHLYLAKIFYPAKNYAIVKPKSKSESKPLS